MGINALMAEWSNGGCKNKSAAHLEGKVRLELTHREVYKVASNLHLLSGSEGVKGYTDQQEGNALEQPYASPSDLATCGRCD